MIKAIKVKETIFSVISIRFNGEIIRFTLPQIWLRGHIKKSYKSTKIRKKVDLKDALTLDEFIKIEKSKIKK